MKQGECIFPLSWSVHCDFVRDGERGVGVHLPPSPAWAYCFIMMECTPESGRCHSMCTLWRYLTIHIYLVLQEAAQGARWRNPRCCCWEREHGKLETSFSPSWTYRGTSLKIIESYEKIPSLCYAGKIRIIVGGLGRIKILVEVPDGYLFNYVTC